MGIGNVGNNSRMSIDRPKPANSNTSESVSCMRKCYNQRFASKTAKKTLMQCNVGRNSIHKSINNDFND